MNKLSREDLYSLEQYQEMRPEFRARVMAHKQNRRVELGEHANLYFEDRLLMQYQIQEMLRVEKIFDAEGIKEELDAYNPMIPDGKNLKATFMVEFSDVEERRQALQAMVGIEDQVWIRVGEHTPVKAIADEDLERSTEEKTSSVHFMRFEFTDEMIADLKNGAALSMGIDHDAYRQDTGPLPGHIRDALSADFD